MCRKFPWTRIDPLFHGFQYLTEQDVIYYHLEYSKGGYQKSPANQWVSNYKKGIEHRGEKQWHYKEEAIKNFAHLIIETPLGDNCILLAGPPSKRRDSPLFDSRNEDVLKIVNKVTGIPISFNLGAIHDIEPIHIQGGYRNPAKLKGLYAFIPFENIPDIVYIVDDVITSGSHYVVWRDLIHQTHPGVEVRGIYLARTVNDEF
ncbi:MAG: hypothetical protein LBP69_07100 [Treponema sp.]|jgi:hypothetical protein|nr:hypothetical protein [Treponema sp.]